MKKTLILNLLIALAISASAHAGSVYIGGGIYAADSDTVIASAENFDLDDSDTVVAGFLGYRFTNGIAVEAGYYDLGTYSSEFENEGSALVDAEGISASIVASVKIAPLFSIYGKAGYIYVDNNIELDLEDETLDYFRDDSNTDVIWGLGLDFSPVDRVAIYAEYIRVDTEAKVDLMGAGIRLSF